MRMLTQGREMLLSLVGCCVIGGCGSPTRPHYDGCLGSVNIALTGVGEGSTPRFDWSPACGISQVSVNTVPGPGAAPILVWALSAPEQSPIGPSIVYGIVPRGATSSHAAEPLVHGVTYRIFIAYTVGGDGVAGSGEETFTF